MKASGHKLRYYYDVQPVDVSPREYTDLWFWDNWEIYIPYRTGARGKIGDYWYKDNQATKKYRIEMEKEHPGMKCKIETYVQRFAITFDIETNSYTERNSAGHVTACEGYAYHMQICVNNIIIHCNKWEQVKKVFDLISTRMELGQIINNKRYIARVWIANEAFEFSFMNQYFRWRNIFAADMRKPIIAETECGFMYQDALYISGASLESLAETYNTPTKKTHDLDYSKMRISTTPLTDKELYYTSADVRILAEFNDWIMINYVDNGLDVPMTKTQMLRDSIKKCFNETEIVKGKLSSFANRLQEIHSQTYDEYTNIVRYLYRGGYCHANRLYADTIVEDVNGVDFTSSYPYCCLMQDFPVTPFRPVTVKSLDDVTALDDAGYAVILRVRFRNLQNRTLHSIESISKTEEYEKAAQLIHEASERGENTVSQYTQYRRMVNPTVDNGRILRADTVTVWLTELDLRVYKMYYTWDDNPEILMCKKAKKGLLPDYVRYPIMVYYAIKCNLKRSGQKDTTAYCLAKEMVNAAYGMMCEKLHLSDIIFDGDTGQWALVDPEEDMIDSEYDSEIFGRCKNTPFIACRKKLPTIWGVYTTANARYNLLSMLYELGDNGIYCDTDSIYIDNIAAYMPVIDKYNQRVIQQNRAILQRWNDIHQENEKVKPVDISLFEDIGTFELIDKDNYPRFKTLGAKRYVKEHPDGTIEQTIAGLPKGKLSEYCHSFPWGADPFDVFEDSMELPAVKRAHRYNDKPHSRVITDYLGNSELMSEQSSCGIFDVDFSMNLSSDYMRLLRLRYEMLKRKWYKGEFSI